MRRVRALYVYTPHVSTCHGRCLCFGESRVIPRDMNMRSYCFRCIMDKGIIK